MKWRNILITVFAAVGLAAIVLGGVSVVSQNELRKWHSTLSPEDFTRIETNRTAFESGGLPHGTIIETVDGKLYNLPQDSISKESVYLIDSNGKGNLFFLKDEKHLYTVFGVYPPGHPEHQKKSVMYVQQNTK